VSEPEELMIPGATEHGDGVTCSVLAMPDRVWLAGQALPAVIQRLDSREVASVNHTELVANACVIYADAVLARLREGSSSEVPNP
jgi:hypothetical protein